MVVMQDTIALVYPDDLKMLIVYQILASLSDAHHQL